MLEVDATTDKAALRLPAILGPFNSIHKKLIKNAYEKDNLQILHHQLSCFDALIELVIGGTKITSITASPSDLRMTVSPYHQLLLFNMTIELPLQLFSSTVFQISLVLRHTIGELATVVLAKGETNSLINGRIIFPLYGDYADETKGACICDILRIHAPSIALPLYSRVLSPSIDGNPSSSYEIAPSNTQFIGDIAEFSGTISDTFAALIVGPSLPEGYDSMSESKFKLTRLFKSAEIPPRSQLIHLKSLINKPCIEELTEAEFNEIAMFKKFASQFPSGFLKLASQNIYVNFPDLPSPMALLLLSNKIFPNANERAIGHAIKSLNKSNRSDIRYLAAEILEISHQSSACFYFMVERSLEDPEFAVSIYWCFQANKSDEVRRTEYKPMYQEWKKKLIDQYPGFKIAKKELFRLQGIVDGVKNINGRENKIKYIQENIKLITFEKPFRLPLCPSFVVTKVSADRAIVFGSSLQPVKLDFIDANGNVYPAIVKVGDDMRQDALAMTCVRFVDDNLKKFNINMHLSPYSVLPISRTFGLCEFVVGAKSISKVLQQNSNLIENFFEMDHKEECRDIFRKSSAAYTVISYVLGVGDRHLDNLLMTPSGRFLHVDFGFMFGQDPKPLPCAVRVVSEMVDAYDDPKDPKKLGYMSFLRHCEVVYNAIRRKADEFCSIVAAMITADLPHLPSDRKVVSKLLLDKLQLELTEKQAGQKLVNEIEGSVKAFAPKLFEIIHAMVTKPEAH